MARTKSRWVCQQCGFQTGRFLGRCTECNSWNSLVEEFVAERAGPGKSAFRSPAQAAAPQPLATVSACDEERISTGLTGVDQVLGGGLVPGAVVLLAGDPGVGKSTLLLQMSAEVANRHGPVIYVTGEESAKQVAMRAQRLGITSERILVYAEQDITAVEERLKEGSAAIVIVDSIQSVFHPEITSAAGSVSQVRESAAVLAAVAKQRNLATIIVGHVTKDGSIAGPRVLEHMVDVVLQFEGERGRQLRVLRAVKNRYGATAEVGIFTMTEAGLAAVDNPSALFLGSRLSKLAYEKAPSGTAVIAGGDTKALLLEVQALVGPTPFPGPRRVANGWDNNRLLQILAVLERKVGLALSRFDVYVNIVGGFDFNEPAGDLGVSIAVATSFLDRSVDPRLICIGEVGLTGEVRPVAGLERHLKEACRLGFAKALVPAGNLPLTAKIDQMEIIGIEYLVDALTAVMPGENFSRSQRRAVLTAESN